MYRFYRDAAYADALRARQEAPVQAESREDSDQTQLCHVCFAESGWTGLGAARGRKACNATYRGNSGGYTCSSASSASDLFAVSWRPYPGPFVRHLDKERLADPTRAWPRVMTAREMLGQMKVIAIFEAPAFVRRHRSDEAT